MAPEPRPKLTEKQWAALAAVKRLVDRYGYVTTADVAEALDISWNAAYSRLSRLTWPGYDRPVLLFDESPSWEITPAGRQALREREGS